MPIYLFHADYLTPKGWPKTFTRDIEADSLMEAQAKGMQKLHRSTKQKPIMRVRTQTVPRQEKELSA